MKLDEITIDIKMLLTLLSGAAIFAGFYYTTQHRLEHIETQIQELREEVAKVKKSVKNKRNK